MVRNDYYTNNEANCGEGLTEEVKLGFLIQNVTQLRSNEISNLLNNENDIQLTDSNRQLLRAYISTEDKT